MSLVSLPASVSARGFPATATRRTSISSPAFAVSALSPSISGTARLPVVKLLSPVSDAVCSGGGPVRLRWRADIPRQRPKGPPVRIAQDIPRYHDTVIGFFVVDPSRHISDAAVRCLTRSRIPTTASANTAKQAAYNDRCLAVGPPNAKLVFSLARSLLHITSRALGAGVRRCEERTGGWSRGEEGSSAGMTGIGNYSSQRGPGHSGHSLIAQVVLLAMGGC